MHCKVPGPTGPSPMNGVHYGCPGDMNDDVYHDIRKKEEVLRVDTPGGMRVTTPGGNGVNRKSKRKMCGGFCFSVKGVISLYENLSMVTK